MTTMYFGYAGLAFVFHGNLVTVISDRPGCPFHDSPWTGTHAELAQAIEVRKAF